MKNYMKDQMKNQVSRRRLFCCLRLVSRPPFVHPECINWYLIAVSHWRIPSCKLVLHHETHLHAFTCTRTQRTEVPCQHKGYIAKPQQLPQLDWRYPHSKDGIASYKAQRPNRQRRCDAVVSQRRLRPLKLCELETKMTTLRTALTVACSK
jgi:hypothetical protein